MPARFLAAYSAACLLLPAASAESRRRGEDVKAVAVLTVILPFPTKFNDTIVPPGKHRVSFVAGKMAFINPVNMVTRAAVAVDQSTAEAAVRRPSASLKVRQGRVTVTIRQRDQVYVAQGRKTARVAPPAGPNVELASKREMAVEDGGDIERSEPKLVQNALRRYLKSLKPCADRAHRARWKTDDPRFASCVCPLTEKWRLPPVSKKLRVHQPLARGRSGFSFTVTEKGRATDCRVWVGPTPPADEIAPAKSADGGDDEAASSTPAVP